MEAEIILLDTSMLIDFYRKKDKRKTKFWSLSNEHIVFSVSAITHFEIYASLKGEQKTFWDNLFHDLIILPVNIDVSLQAVKIDADLKKARKQIAVPDLFIAATAVTNKLRCATLNKKHFERVNGLMLVEH